MGTTKEWLSVAISGTFWGGFMLLWDVFVGSFTTHQPGFSYRKVLIWSLAGFWFGLWSTFEARAFRWPLLALNLTALAGAAIVARMYRKRT